MKKYIGENESRVLCAEEGKVKVEQWCPTNERNFNQNDQVTFDFQAGRE
jgi:hypothetical protein